MLTPLELIPDKYALDPSRGVRAILDYFPALTELRTSPGRRIGEYRVEVVTRLYATGHGIGNNVPFSFWYDERAGSKAYLTQLAECAQAWQQTHPPVPEKPIPDDPIAAALSEARARPSMQQPVAHAEDAFVARVIARRSLAHDLRS